MIRGDRVHKESSLAELERLDTAVSRIRIDTQVSHDAALRLNRLLETLHVSRLQRISLAHDAISVTKWTSPIVLAVLTLVTVAVVHLRRPRAMMISLALTILCVMATIQVLSRNRSPYIGTAAVSSSLLYES